MEHVFHRDPRSQPPVAVAGDGVYIIDSNGKRYLDASGGAAVSALGHSDPAVRAAIKAQVDQIAYAHTAFFTTEAAEELAALLCRRAPAGLDRVVFVSGGSEAIEAALKLARQYFVETGESRRSKFIARRQSYHGNTLGALGVGGNMWRRADFEPLLTSATLVAPCYEYRDRRAGEGAEAYGLRVANELEAAILQLGPDSVAGFIAETVVGATSGALPPVPGYFKRIREICDRYGVLLILDEVMCGAGRTGTFLACEQEGIRPDIAVLAKGLGAGYQPIGAVLAAGAIYDAITSGSGAFQHGHTYMGHATACAAALAVQRVVEVRKLLPGVQRLGEVLDAALHDRFGDHAHVGDIRGRGLLRAIELVAERETKAPFDANARLHARIRGLAMERGLICYPMGGTIDGRSGDHVLLAPPFIIDETQIAEVVAILGDAVDAAVREVQT